MDNKSEEGDKSLESELERYTKLLVAERTKLKKLRRQKTYAASACGDAGNVAEEQLLFEDNAKLRRAVEKLKRGFRNLKINPCVIELQNKVAAVWKEVAEAETEVNTLRVVRRERRKGLNKMRAGERSVSVIRCRQYKDQARLREELKELAEELKQVERRDNQLHERLAHLQEQVMMNVKEKDVAALRQRKKEQLKTIENLQRRQEELASRRTESMDVERRAVLLEKKAKEKMKSEIEELKVTLAQRNEELCRLYYNGRKTSL